jgi:threonine aldolase
MVYLSQPTEWGTTYTKQELRGIRQVCREHQLFLYIDGARLAYGLAEPGCSVDIPALAEYCDLFYIGGTKCGALFGEALVIVNPVLRKDFHYLIKQKGAMLAKGRLLGIQFETLFTNGLYEQIGRHGVAQAERLREACRQAGYEFYIENGTNQVFPILPKERLELLKENYSFLDMGRTADGRKIVRFCTSWGTQEEDVEELVMHLKG